MNYLKRIWSSKRLRYKILFTLAAIVIVRFASAIPVPGANVQALRNILEGNSFLGAFAVLTGGSMDNFSIILMGLSPYINASIIMQLMTVVVPKLESLSKEGDTGRKRINSYTRWLTLPLSFLQSYGMILLLNKLGGQTQLVPDTSITAILPMMLMITAGTLFLMWLGEVISEHGIGNGISIIIFTSIVSGIPTIVGQQLGLAQYDQSQLVPFFIIVAITALLTAFVVTMTEAQRNIPITYAGRSTKGGQGTSFIPIRLNQAGMIPIIFAVSMVTFPQVLAGLFVNASTQWLRDAANWVNTNFSQTSTEYVIALFAFVFFFTFFYVSITFNPQQVAENIQKRGGFVPGIRPGINTVQFLGKTSLRLNLWGGFFLGFISIFPFILNKAFSQFSLPSVPLLIGGAGVIIIVGVIIEIIRQINADLLMRDYEAIK